VTRGPSPDRATRPGDLNNKLAYTDKLGEPADEAREWIARMLAVNPVHTIAWFRNFGGKFLSAATLAIWVEGLRRAGLPEE
jgi:hypothetical protein